MLRKLWNDEIGAIISAELVLVMTITVLAMVVGLQAVSRSVNHELNDLAQAFSVLDQTFTYQGLINPGRSFGHRDSHAHVHGSGFRDAADNCDCSELENVTPMPKRDSGRRPENASRGQR